MLELPVENTLDDIKRRAESDDAVAATWKELALISYMDIAWLLLEVERLRLYVPNDKREPTKEQNTARIASLMAKHQVEWKKSR